MRGAAGRTVAAILLAVAGALAYRAAVRPVLEHVTIEVLDDARRPIGRAVRVALPDLSRLGASRALVRGTLRNGVGAQRVRVMLGSVVRAEVELAERAHGGFAFELPAGSIQATVAGDERYGIYLVGEHDDWQVERLQASNVYAAAGVVATIAPVELQADGPGPMLAWTLLALLAGLSAAWGRSGAATRVRGVEVAAMAAVGLACTALWVLPLVAGRRLLVSSAVYWPTMALGFAPSIVAARGRWAARFWRQHQTTCERAAMLLGLVALAIVQPVFDVLQGSPEFFVARNTTASAAVFAVALVAVGLPLALLGVERILRVASPKTAAVFAYAVIGLLVALMVHPWITRGDLASPVVMAAGALAAGAAAATVAWRSAAFRSVLAALAPAALVVPFLFFTSPTVAQSFTPSSTFVRTPPLATTPPIVFVVFDEFPLLSLLDEREQIDAVRFPGFAALARQATWYREATAVSSQTVWAVPAIASGRYPVAPHAVPTLRYYPQNLFTLLADRYRMHVFGRFLQLCPESACVRDAGGPSDGPAALLSDLGVVWLHVVAPAPLADYLPPVVGDWAGFARAGRFRMVNGERVRDDRRSQFGRFLESMTAEPARLYFLHSLLPHMSFEYVPSERTYQAPDFQQRKEGGAGLFERVDAAYADSAHQRHLLQVGFVDTLVGHLIARLRDLGIWDEALLIVTADHGASYREGMPRRTASTENLADIVRVPLFIKAPGQRQGAIVDGVAESVDILPTIAAALGASLPFQVDGRSLVDPQARTRSTRTFIARSETNVSRRNVSGWRLSSDVSLARRIARFGVGSYDRLYAVPGTESLIGRSLDSFTIRDSPIAVRMTGPEAFDAVDLDGETLPLYVRGRVLGRPTQPVAIALNGRIVATTMAFLERGRTVFSTMIPEHALRAGANELATFFVDGAGGSASLLAPRPPE